MIARIEHRIHADTDDLFQVRLFLGAALTADFSDTHF